MTDKDKDLASFLIHYSPILFILGLGVIGMGGWMLWGNHMWTVLKGIVDAAPIVFALLFAIPLFALFIGRHWK